MHIHPVDSLSGQDYTGAYVCLKHPLSVSSIFFPIKISRKTDLLICLSLGDFLCFHPEEVHFFELNTQMIINFKLSKVIVLGFFSVLLYFKFTVKQHIGLF